MKALRNLLGATFVLSLTSGVAAAQSDATPKLNRISVAVRYGVFRPRGHSEAFQLIERDLIASGKPTPVVAGLEASFAVTPRWTVVTGIEGGSNTQSSLSRARATQGNEQTAQQTTFSITSSQYVGADYLVIALGESARPNQKRPQIRLGAGVGSNGYRLRQWGTFVDAARFVSYSDDFQSAGRGGFAYANASADLPLTAWLSFRGEVRQQFGSAAMNQDYREFDRIDLSGTRFSAGFRINPFSR